MSKSVAKASPKAPAPTVVDSVYDFLYHDARRVGSFLAQLDQNGLLTEIRKGEHAAKNAKRGWNVNVGASTPLTGGGNLGVEVSPKEGGGESIERTYDPFWANARELLDALAANDMIVRDVEGAPLGSMILTSGTLNVVNIGMMKNAWDVDEIKRTVLAGGTVENLESEGNRAVRRAQQSRNRSRVNSDSPPTNDELTFAFLKLLPHSLTAMLHGSLSSVWCSLQDQYLVGSSGDIVLKHGYTVPGEWHMLGVLDAKPDADVAGESFAHGFGSFNSIIGNLAQQLAPLVRVLLGRPADAYGITPLLIFRKVA
jgi:hypothetical protein